MHESNGTTRPLNFRSKLSDSSAYLPVVNHTNVGAAQRIAYLDFGFAEPPILEAIVKTAKDGPRDTRVVMGIDVLARLYQQIQQVLFGIRDVRQPRAKDSM